jgi:p-cumate 2,3-dioxygenase alpha subunit
MRDAPYIIDDRESMRFQLNRSVLVDPEVLERERTALFDRCWIYLGHESEVGKPGDFVTRAVAGRPVIFARDSAGATRCFLNSCTHRGAMVCRDRAGNRGRFSCLYHGWAFDIDGRLAHVPAQDSYGPNFDRADFALKEVPRLEDYRGFFFVNFWAGAEPLADYLAGAKEYLDLVVDQAASGRFEVIEGTQEYDIRANWKLLVENSFDDYHLPATHASYLEYMKDSGVDVRIPKGLVMPKRGVGKALGNGHAVIDNINFRGRPVAAWIDLYGEAAKPVIEAKRAELVERLGEERAFRVADTNRNLVIFPNLVINDGSAVTIRTFWPTAVDRMRVTAWAAGPEEESEAERAIRLDSFLTFYGPGGLATPDDVEVLEMVQRGLATWREVPWSEISRGMNKDGEQLNTDELHLRAFWRQWNALMTAAGGGMTAAGEAMTADGEAAE